ncbi:MAG: bifunctional 4-hydroxy-2-oxoglutarate aldolase/2-dehydro-3-deoxy-phosphogluconate aldolase [Clostridiales bacterium]|jgi:2-dehydro-3-deoxyphosphogluconate aldolase/(4S)-4-hydroxy-2-oxoglutarate aldolase|nr:bifunctional 4-hydroxy-2-oxoglutarate aldolase/2-dehydro-3-deoxy-phosphogluconate aldolase [Clostridiales bacterium]
MHEVLERISEIGIVPVIAIQDEGKAVPLAKALSAGGIPCAEVTFRTAQGEESIRRIAKDVPEVLLGAGTVTTAAQVDRAIDAGAKFIVSPGFNPKIVAYCLQKNIPITPGCANPSDIEAAMEFGLEVVKFFPAEQAGGIDYIKAIAAPYTGMRFIPTGGVNAGNINKYLAFEKIIACGGSWMVSADLLNAGDFDGITRLCKEAVRTVQGFELAYVGINSASEQEALGMAELFAAAFGFEVKNGNSSVFAGSGVEVMKEPYLGKHGHIGIRVNSVPRAMAYLKAKGFGFNDSTAKTDAKGKISAVYLEKEFGGFAVHIVQKK